MPYRDWLSDSKKPTSQATTMAAILPGADESSGLAGLLQNQSPITWMWLLGMALNLGFVLFLMQ